MKKIYKSLLGIALSLGVITSVNAQTVVTIGVGTASTTGVNYNPIYRSSAASAFDFSRAYFLYTAAELVAAGVPSGATITKIEWDKSNTGATITTTSNVVFNILMNNSTSTDYSTTQTWGTLSTGATPVYTNNTQVIPATTGFLPFTLTSPFVYSGNSLEILTDWDISAVAGSPTTAGFAFNTTLVSNRVGGNSNSAALTGTTTMGTQGNRPNIRITFTPPPVCSGLPSAGNVVASNTLLCSPQAVNLSLTGTSAVSGLSYQWLSSPDGISWSPIPTATNSTTSPTVISTTYYQCAVACGTDVATSSTMTITYGTIPVGGTSISSSTLICSPQNVNLSLTGASSFPGLTYQWLSSPTGVGYTPISSATLATSTQSVTGTIYYQNLLTCGTSTALSTPVQVDIATTTTNTVPYFEGFEGISATGQYPNCSWLPSGDWTTQIGLSPTYLLGAKTGSKFAYTRWSTIAGGDILYSNGIQLNTGVTYFASVNYAVSPNSAAFDELTMLVSPNQSTVSAVSIASVAAITNSVYATLSNTFTVPSSGLYYLGFKVVSPTSSPDHIGIDDISVIVAPTCTLAPVAGVISGTTSTNIGSTNAYTVSPATGNIQWYSGSSATGPWSAISGATLATNQNITATSAGTVYYTTIASTPGCPNDTSNTALAVTVLFPGNDACSPIALSTGTSSVFSLLGATTQTGEVAPPNVGCTVNNGWCNSTLHNTMWFTFVAPTSGNVSVQSPSFDTQLAIWSTTNCASLIGQATPTAPVGAKLIAANDDDGGALDASNVKASCLTPGATYYIQLDSYNAATSTSTTSIVITDLGAYDASFGGLASSYCLPASSSSLTPAVSGGVFTVSGSTTTVTSFTPSTVGTFTVTYNNVSTACMTSSTTVVANTPSVSAASNSTLSCDGAPVALTASTSATSYTWLPSGGNGITANVSPTTTTVYTVTVADGACTASATVTQNVNTCTGLQTLTSNTANMYPNPNTGLVNIALSADLMNGSSILVYDALGKLVLSQNLTNEVNAINTSKLEAGIYMYTIINNNQTVKVGRMIKQ